MQAKKETVSRARESVKSLLDAANSLSRFQMCVIGAIALLLILGAVFTYARSRPKTVRIIGSKPISSKGEGGSTTDAITVHVAGAVNSPGLYRLPEGSRIADALSKAGGPSPDAVLENVNLAARLRDGEKVLVPRRSEAAAAAGGTGAQSEPALININTATVEELEKLPGVGPALAQRIVDYREKNGSFSSVDDLDNVEGIGSRRLETLKDLVTI